MKKSPLVSIIIPCYNASEYIGETLESILRQDECCFEIIIIDDGSTDYSKRVIDTFKDERISYTFQNNRGVSSARNFGFKNCKGEYVVFFDADDIMTMSFLSSRLRVLESDYSLDFISGQIQKFNKTGLLEGKFRGTGSDLEEEVLLYKPEVVTCPSNYMFRYDFLVKNGVSFRETLSSTADKFFLLECAKYGNSRFDDSISMLKYRVNMNSMSHKLTKSLVVDNENFYKELSGYGLIPDKIRNKSLFLRDFILFASYWKIGFKMKSLKFVIKCFLRSPIGFIKKCAL